MITLYRHDPDGTTRYITYTDRQGNLFGYPTLTVESGRNLILTNESHMTYESGGELQAALRKMIDARLRERYQVLYSYFRPGSYGDLRGQLDSAQGGP